MKSSILTISPRIAVLGIVIITLLAIPFVAMQFSNEVNWTVFDFAVAGSLLFILAMCLEISLRTFVTPKSKLIALSASIVVFMLIWIELAVGLFGSPLAGS